MPVEFTTESAKAAQLLSAASQRRKRLAPEILALLSADKLFELDIVEEQIARARKTLNKEDVGYCEHCKRAGMTPQAQAQLLRSLDTLLERRRILLGRPLPGSLRPAAPTKGKARSSDDQPTEADNPWDGS